MSADLTLSQVKQRANLLGGLINSLVTGNFNSYSWSATCSDPDCGPAEFMNQVFTPIAALKTQLDNINTSQFKLFDSQASSKTLQSLVLWADVYRQSISYPLNKAGNQADFQKAYLADALVDYVRSAGAGQDAGTAAGQGSVGNFLGSEAKTTATSGDFETVTVTLPGSSGFTAIGRFALPGVPVQVKLSSLPATGSFTVFFNPIRPGSTKVWETPSDDRYHGYLRPLFLQSPQFSLTTDAITLLSPYGGVLQLGYDSASASSVTLQIKGTAKHPFYDTTQGTPDAARFFADVKASKLGWMEIKTPGLEVHSLISNAMDFLQPSTAQLADVRNVFPSIDKPYYNRSTGVDMAKYLYEAKKYVMDDAYQFAGFQARGLTLSASVQSFCTSHHWDCTSTAIHVPPSIQHYTLDVRANCGGMCSGHPIIDSESAFDPRGWGETHELGHNLQDFKLYDTVSSEVSNNMFSLHKKWRMLRDLGRASMGYGNELNEAQVVFDLLKSIYKDTSKPGTAEKIAQIRAELWTEATARQNRSRLYFYVQWPLIYFEALKAGNPSMSDDQAWEQAWDIYTLLYLHKRQINAATDATWPSLKTNLGFGQYNTKPSTQYADGNGNFPIHDVMLVSFSLVTGRDQRPVFDFWGVITSDAAKNQVAAMNLPAQAMKFYATRCSDDFRTYTTVDMTQNNPVFPWPNDFKTATETSAQATAKQNTNTSYCLSRNQ